MTREELRKEATMTVEWECTLMIDRPLFVHTYITGAEPREKRIAELEKENAELKEQCLILADCNTCNSTCKTENIEMKKQLTKAKEIIEKLYSHIFQGMCFMGINDYNVHKAEVEQYISEVENQLNR